MDEPVPASKVSGVPAAVWDAAAAFSTAAGARTSALAAGAVGADANTGSGDSAPEASPAGSKTPGTAAGNGAAPVTRSLTGCTTGSRMGTASTSGGPAASASPATAPSVAAAIGTATAETVPAGTTVFITGTAATTWSVVLARLPTAGSRRPVCVADGAVGDFFSKRGLTVAVSGAETDETDDVTPPSKYPESVEESAVAAEEDRVSQVAVTAPARRTGRSTCHGERTFATRTTPSTYR